MPHAGDTAAWHVLTCGYPPEIGGLSSYSRTVAEALAAHGPAVHVWSPGPADREAAGVRVHASPVRWSIADLRRVGRELDACPAPRRLFLQWVPHGYGYKSLNVPFVLWIASRAMRRREQLELMVHEPWLALDGGSIKRTAAAIVHRGMAAILLRASAHAWVSIPAWRDALQRLAGRTRVEWLPVPSQLAVIDDPASVRATRATLAPNGELVVGHFGTYGTLITDLLGTAAARVLGREQGAIVVLIGQGSTAYRERFVADHPAHATRVVATGTLDERHLSLHVQACDVMLQPYPDGISARRSTATALLAHARAVVTTGGRLTEPLWGESGAAWLVPVDPAALAEAVVALLGDADRRAAFGDAAARLHDRVFAVDRTVGVLLGHELRPASAW